MAACLAGGLAGVVQIERFDPTADSAALHVCNEIYLAAARADAMRRPPMSPTAFRAWLTYGWTEDPAQAWLARDEAGQACGWYLLGLPERENRHAADLSLMVAPAHRRAGLGTALAAHAAGRARQAGRTMLLAQSAEGSAGEKFARSLGARHRLTGIFQVLRLDSVPPARRDALRRATDAKAAGYSLLSWEGPTAEDRLREVAVLFAAEADAPRAAGDDALVWNTARVREDERRTDAQGLRYYTVAARLDRTGTLVAITQLGVDPLQDGWAFQELTAVVRPHRGHRLGLLVKVAMLDLLAAHEPQLSRIITHAVEGNEHMTAINAQLGFEPLERELDWELEIASGGTTQS